MPAQIELLDIAWIVLCAGLVMLMQGGFCCLETGLSRSKNSINVAIKNLSDFCVAATVFWFGGFALMFGVSRDGWVGTSLFMPGREAGPWLIAFLLYQLVFCGTATTIISGAVAERIRFRGYLLVSLIVSAAFYPLFGHWAWAGAIEGHPAGWLARLGFIDFAGSTVVHSVGGWLALAAVLVVGPRLGRFEPGKPPMRGSNVPLAMLGVFLLWFGWFGFNGGSTLAVTDRVPIILLNTNLAAAAGGVGALLLSLGLLRRPDVGLVMNGVLAGLVGITASCHLVEPWSAMVIGAVAGAVAVLGMKLLERWHVDDVVGAVPVHAFGGVWGTLAVALFIPASELPLGTTRGSQLLVQGLGVSVCFGWAFVLGYTVLWILNRVLPLRASAEAERLGLNVAEHDAGAELLDLLCEMEAHRERADFSRHVAVEPHTEVGQIAREYNRVLDRVAQEITTQEEALAALRRAEEKYRGIFENAVEGIFQTTPDGRYIAANPSLARIYGYDSPEQLQASVHDVTRQLYVDPERREEFVRLMRLTGAITGFESQIYRRDGSIIWISENARVIRDAAGQVLYYEGTVEDITERKNSADLAAEKEAAVAASRAKSEFLANMSHEIRTPLNGVIGMLDLMVGTALTPQQQRYARIAKSSADSLLSLINQILDFSKIEAGKLELELIDFDLQLVVEDAVELFTKRAMEKRVELVCHISPQLPTAVRGDQERLRQVLINLLGNAIKFTDRGQVVVHVVATAETADTVDVQFRVRDTGIGIPADRRHRLFQSFTQIDASTTRKYGGTGLGLAITQRLVELMGGSITVESEVGQGSEFSFTIPLSKQQAAGHRRLLPDHLRSMRVLAVDDNHTNLEILQEQFAAWRVHLEVATDAQSALFKLDSAMRRGKPFDLAILDVQMPDTDGYELARLIKSHADLASTRLLVLTSMGEDLTDEQLRAADIAGHLHKPVRQSRLLDAIVDAVGEPLREEPRKSLQSPTTVVRRSGRILVAEDNEINQIVVSEILHTAGFECDLVGNGLAACERALQGTYDLVLMDCQMPEMDGLEAARRIRQQEQRHGVVDRRLPIIALTANAIKGDRERCLAAGMDDYLSKPIDSLALISTIESLLGELGHEPPAADDPATHTGNATRPETGPPLAPIGAPLDLDELLERCLGNAAVAEKVLRKFCERAPEQLAQLQRALCESDLATVARTAHLLKGIAGNLATHSVAELAVLLEEAALQSNYERSQSLAGQLSDAITEIQTVIPNMIDQLSQKVN
jgi:Amt family ammonium transporter